MCTCVCVHTKCFYPVLSDSLGGLVVFCVISSKKCRHLLCEFETTLQELQELVPGQGQSYRETLPRKTKKEKKRKEKKCRHLRGEPETFHPGRSRLVSLPLTGAAGPGVPRQPCQQLSLVLAPLTVSWLQSHLSASSQDPPSLCYSIECWHIGSVTGVTT